MLASFMKRPREDFLMGQFPEQPTEEKTKLLPIPPRNLQEKGKALHPLWPLMGLFLIVSIIVASLLHAAKGNIYPPMTPQPFHQSANSDPAKLFHPALKENPPYFGKTWSGKYIEENDFCRFIYTVDPALQTCVNEIFRNYRPPYCVFVALEPKTGRLLALADYARENPDNPGVWQRATYPAASIFKLVTAAGALEKGVLNYDSPVSYRGNQYRLGPNKINQSSKRERQTYFDEALGKSNNVVFARVASQLLGSQTLRQYCEAFGFNQPIQFDFPLEISRAWIPEESYELARCGAGFGEVTLNPLHAAMIAGAIANRGVMMRPYLIDVVLDQNGERIYQAQKEVLAQPIHARTALDLSRMMLRTVEDGTASKIFHRYGKNLMRKVTICGKTGSLSGNNPPGFYDWFIGFAPGDDPQIAFAVMIVNQEHWRIRGAYVAQEALKTFFREQIN
jgi:cell division protein FtsI/penicillin-binding protein 2